MFENYYKMSHLNFWILAFYTNFVPLKVTCLVILFDRKVQVFQILNVECDFLGNFQTLCNRVNLNRKVTKLCLSFFRHFFMKSKPRFTLKFDKKLFMQSISDRRLLEFVLWNALYNCNATRVCIWNFGHPNISQPHERQKQPSCKWQCHDMFMSQLW